MKAFAYLRTSSATNVGTDKDSDKRQRAAIDAYAAANGVEIVAEFYDASVSGTDAIESLPGFMDMLTAIAAAKLVAELSQVAPLAMACVLSSSRRPTGSPAT